VTSGDAVEDTSLHGIIYWMVARSSWGRWQAAQNHVEQTGEPNQLLLPIAFSHFLHQLESGKLFVRGRRTDNLSYEELSPDFWKSKFFRMLKYNISIWKVHVVWRPDGADPTPIGYDHFCCDLRRVKIEFPEQDVELDARTASILENKDK
jgi:hypothetical protein